MNVTIFPVSGGGFPVQLGLISILTDRGIKPRISVGSSGGNVAQYVALAAEWKAEEIPRLASLIQSWMFSSSWWPSGFSYVLPSWMIGYFKGSIYASGEGANSLIKSVFSNKTPLDTELWTGTLNRTTSKGEFFCNLSKGASELCQSDIDLRELNIEPLSYMNGDVELISSVTVASASIPALVPDKKIGENSYCDGGTVMASPYSALEPAITALSTKLSQPLHLIYINSYDMESSMGPASYSSVLMNEVSAAKEIIRNLIIQDRLSCIECLKEISTNIKYISLKCTQDTLNHVEEYKSRARRSLLELYVKEDYSIDLMSFNGDDIIKSIEKSKHSAYMRFWWVE
jgi:hypothetical protein